ncbi:patatin-like phospholipase family protein [Patescibacteria group bacterium]
MHPVIKHIYERKNRTVPVNDGRNITLVLFGGVMAGITGAGAIVALSEMGFKNAFDRIYTYSAGFANASYLLTGETQKGISIYYENLVDNKFINPFRFWKIVDINYLLHVMRDVKPLNVNAILSQRSQLFVGLKNITTNKIEFIDVHSISPQQYFKLLEASMSLPYLHPGSVMINNTPYEDIGGSDINIEKISLAHNPTDLLVIYNLDEQKKIFQCSSEKIFELMPSKDWQLHKYERNSNKLKNSAQHMGSYVKSLFGSNENIQLY